MNSQDFNIRFDFFISKNNFFVHEILLFKELRKTNFVLLYLSYLKALVFNSVIFSFLISVLQQTFSATTVDSYYHIREICKTLNC